MASPPVVKFLDFGQYKYELTKREKEAKRKQRSVTFKEVRLKPKIGSGDFDTKVRRAIQFLEEGDRIKVAVQFRGRELTHPEIGRSLLTRFSEQIKDHGVVERSPLLEGKSMHITVASVHKPKFVEHQSKHPLPDEADRPAVEAPAAAKTEPATTEPAAAKPPAVVEAAVADGQAAGGVEAADDRRRTSSGTDRSGSRAGAEGGGPKAGAGREAGSAASTGSGRKGGPGGGSKTSRDPSREAGLDDRTGSDKAGEGVGADQEDKRARGTSPGSGRRVRPGCRRSRPTRRPPSESESPAAAR